MRKIFVLLAITTATSLSACASSKPQPINYDMDCTQIQSAIDKTRMALYNEKSSNGGSNAGAVAGTAADVAVTGAGMAGVPYVGGIYSIGRTIFSHQKRTAVSQADLQQIHLDELEYLAERKQCNF